MVWPGKDEILSLIYQNLPPESWENLSKKVSFPKQLYNVIRPHYKLTSDAYKWATSLAASKPRTKHSAVYL